MPTIEDLLFDIKNLPAIIQDGVDRAILGDEFDIVQINKDQLRAGFDANGITLGSYAPSTKIARQRRGLQTAFIDLNFTGRSQDSIKTKKLSNSRFEIVSNPRWDQKRFPNAIGISKQNEPKVDEVVISNIEAVLNVKFL